MALEVTIRGTLQELEKMWAWEKLCLLIRVGYYNRGMVDTDERFTIKQEDIHRVFTAVQPSLGGVQ